MSLTLVLVRHGATTWNESGYCQGRRDVPLSDRGRAQAEQLRRVLADTSFDHVFASPLVRARETARLVTSREPEVIDDLAEIDRGHWEGHAMDEIRRRWGKLCKGWYDDPAGLSMPGGEAFDHLWERAAGALEALERQGTVFACAHKALNRALIARALRRPSKGVWDIPQPQACRTVLVRAADGWTAELIGDASHLPDELRSDR